MPCCVVPHCHNLLQEWIAPFPADQLLQTRWKHCIEMGTGELLPDLKILGPSAVVCNTHFLGFSSDVDGASTRYRQPTLFFRDNIMLEIQSCCLCAQLRIKDEMLGKDSHLTKELTIAEVVKRVFGESYFDDEKSSEYVCEMCTAKVDILLTIHKHLEAGKLMLKTLRHKHTLERVCFRKNKVIVRPLDKGLADKIHAKESKQSIEEQNYVINSDFSLNPLETVIKIEEATLQIQPDELQSMSALEPALNDNTGIKGNPTLTIPLENPDSSAGKVMFQYVLKTRAEYANEVKRTCYLCNTLFSTHPILLAHLVMIHKNTETYRCHDCNFQFKGVVECNNHLKLHDSLRRPVKCDHCPLRFTSTSMRWCHHTKAHPGLPASTSSVSTTESISRQIIVKMVSKNQESIDIQPEIVPVVVKEVPLVTRKNVGLVGDDPSCKTCFKPFESLDILKSHMKSHRSARPPVLREPSTDDTTNDNMISIPTSHPDPTSQPTEIKSVKTITVTSNLSEGKIDDVRLLDQLDLPPLIPFVKKHLSEKFPYSCKTCFKSFETTESLRNHLKTNFKTPSDNEPTKRKRIFRTRKSKLHPCGTFSCSICSQELTTPAALVKHFASSHPQLILDHLRCHFCTDIYFSRETLDVHVASHRGKYECSRCALEFLTHYRLQRHRQAVHKLPPNSLLFRYCQYCGKPFRRGMILAQHVKTHFAGKWTCEICDELFVERYKLILHMRKHTGNNPLVCYNCNEHFGDQEMLDQHERECTVNNVVG